MDPCSVVGLYAASILILLGLSASAIKFNWFGFFKRLFIGGLIVGMLAYPVFIHNYTIRCYQGPCGST